MVGKRLRATKNERTAISTTMKVRVEGDMAIKSIRAGKPSAAKPMLSVVVPMHNEMLSVTPLFERLLPVLNASGCDWEVICVDDGSSDSTCGAVLAYREMYSSIRLIDLSRNFGKEAALSAGLDHAGGDIVVVLDADLQDPPELIPEMIAAWKGGAEIVYAVRRSRSGDGIVKRLTAKIFYAIFNRLVDTPIPPDAGDFRLLDRRVVDALAELPEHARFMKGIFAWVGFRQAAVYFDRPARHSGHSQWSYLKLIRFALDGIFSFSTLPLRLATWVGATTAFFALAYTLYFFVRTLIVGADVPGYPSLIIAIMFLGGIQLIAIGMLGEYVGRIFAEAKARPLYIVRETVGFNGAPKPESANVAVLPKYVSAAQRR